MKSLQKRLDSGRGNWALPYRELYFSIQRIDQLMPKESFVTRTSSTTRE